MDRAIYLMEFNQNIYAITKEDIVHIRGRQKYSWDEV